MCAITNQNMAMDLAERLISGSLPAKDLSDDQWALLLLAADLVHVSHSQPLIVAHRILHHSAEKRGYFANTKAKAFRSDALRSRAGVVAIDRG